jgi:hypothetical protein
MLDSVKINSMRFYAKIQIWPCLDRISQWPIFCWKPIYNYEKRTKKHVVLHLKRKASLTMVNLN